MVVDATTIVKKCTQIRLSIIIRFKIEIKIRNLQEARLFDN